MRARRRALFRADASIEIGTGHLVRCQTLAAELVRRGWAATLATRDLPAGLASSARASGVTLIELPAGGAAEEPAAIATMVGGQVELVVVDHYALGADWHRAVAPWAHRLLAIDDLADRAQVVDMVLNQNLGASASLYVGLVPATTRVLAGPSFALVRPEFAAARARSRAQALEHHGRVERILVFMSGTDPDDMTRRAAEAAASVGVVSVDVVVGAGYPFRHELQAWADERPRIELHVDTPDMASLMARADLAIGAPGSASWERCTLGLPTVLVTLADNQAENARLLGEVGAAVDLGRPTSLAAGDLEEVLKELANDPERLVAMSVAAARITDGRGTIRVADELDRLVESG
ncbi:MAG: UDP-2,4-diacetamido-2,4,6-trideoxy-beta-L-altropyranose hydrolase [Chloroflexota bacterium]